MPFRPFAGIFGGMVQGVELEAIFLTGVFVMDNVVLEFP
jgi:hypothetical protein